MHEFRSLKFLSLFRGVLTRFGVDFDVLLLILKAKLTMDERRTPSIFQNPGKKSEGNQFLKSLWLYGLYGLIVIPFILLGQNYIFQLGIVFGLMMFILTTAMISDFTTVLLDVRDKTILQVKPVNARTISASKIIHVMIYMSFITGAFSTIPVVVGLFRHGIVFTLIFIINIVFAMLFIIVLTALLYVFVLRLFDGERLKDIINYVQILLSVGVIIGYQIFARSFEFIDLNVLYTYQWWHMFLPPLWFGATFEAVLNNDFSTHMVAFASLAVVIPLLSVYVYSKLMPSFERNLEKLLSDVKAGKKKRNGWVSFWSRLTCRSREEQLFFRFSSLMMKQERDFKLKVYPGLGIGLVFPFIFIFNGLRERSLADIGTGKLFLGIYFCNFIIPTVVQLLKYSRNYKGGWIFKGSAIDNNSAAYSGTLKAFLVKLYMPVFLIVSCMFIWIFTMRIVPDLVAVLLGGIVQTLLTYKLINGEEFPFTTSTEVVQEGGGAVMFFISLLTGVFVLMHLLAIVLPFGIYMYIALLLLVTIIGWRFVFPKSSGVREQIDTF